MGRSPRFVGPPETAKSVTACGRIAQLVEQLTLNQRVLGSSPSASTTFFGYSGLLEARQPARGVSREASLRAGAARAPRRAYFLPAASSSASRPCWSLTAKVRRSIRSPVSHRNGRTPFARAFWVTYFIQ